MREIKRAIREQSIGELEHIAARLDAIWNRLHPIPPKKDARVAGEDIPLPTAAEMERDLMAMHVDERDLLIASSTLHQVIDELRLVLPSKRKGGAS